MKAEQSTQDVEIDSQSDTVYLISDDSSLEDEVSTELSRIHNVEDRVDTKDVIKDSENTTTSQDYEVICQKRVLNRSHMNRDSFISKVSTMITSGRSPEALKSILPLPSRPRKTSGRLWSRIKVNQVGTSHQDFYDDDSSEDSTKDGKANDEPTVNDDKNVEEILNNDLSVFLSSQLTRLVDQEWRKTSEVAIKKARKLIESNFTYAKPIVRVNDGPHDNAKGCFYSRLVSLKVNNAGKAKGWFHLYQYNLWNVPMDHGQLQVMFNLKNEEWTALEEAFTMLPNYEFSSINKVDRETHQLSTLQDMDLYLKSISQVNSCYITFKDGEPDQCFATHNPAKKIDNTKAIDPYILETMRTKAI